MFDVGDRIAHPLHGAGVISEIVTRNVNGTQRDYYVMKVTAGDMLLMIPTLSSEAVGIRHIVKSSEADTILDLISGMKVTNNQNWNRRYRENMLKLKSGNLIEVAEVVKSLMSRETERGLSAGEKKMLNSAKQIFISEIVLSKHSTYNEVEEMLDRAVG